ncbi:nuclear pore complex protein nup98-nup96 [Anaeramoeba flamelloides]|uniref:Nuclear pore complex protein nup98-nup96 n=1 Tax=Anaeramoeba flamelloides TaxID=1746091 RepID=A0AAV7YQY5_9EUKA|nr:nuclear pore complex protein nup98-nup96 [Anaeramoeba flamelloides]
MEQRRTFGITENDLFIDSDSEEESDSNSPQSLTIRRPTLSSESEDSTEDENAYESSGSESATFPMNAKMKKKTLSLPKRTTTKPKRIGLGADLLVSSSEESGSESEDEFEAERFMLQKKNRTKNQKGIATESESETEEEIEIGKNNNYPNFEDSDESEPNYYEEKQKAKIKTKKQKQKQKTKNKNNKILNLNDIDLESMSNLMSEQVTLPNSTTSFGRQLKRGVDSLNEFSNSSKRIDRLLKKTILKSKTNLNLGEGNLNRLLNQENLDVDINLSPIKSINIEKQQNKKIPLEATSNIPLKASCTNTELRIDSRHVLGRSWRVSWSFAGKLLIPISSCHKIKKSTEREKENENDREKEQKKQNQNQKSFSSNSLLLNSKKRKQTSQKEKIQHIEKRLFKLKNEQSKRGVQKIIITNSILQNSQWTKEEEKTFHSELLNIYNKIIFNKETFELNLNKLLKNQTRLSKIVEFLDKWILGSIEKKKYPIKTFRSARAVFSLIEALFAYHKYLPQQKTKSSIYVNEDFARKIRFSSWLEKEIEIENKLFQKTDSEKNQYILNKRGKSKSKENEIQKEKEKEKEKETNKNRNKNKRISFSMQKQNSKIDFNNKIKRSSKQKIIFDLLTRHQIKKACMNAIRCGDYRLSTLITQSVNGSEEIKKDLTNQLQLWVENDIVQSYSTDQFKILQLISGDVLPVITDLSWKRAFGCFLWYGTNSNDNLKTAFNKYLVSINQKKVRYPKPSYYNNVDHLNHTGKGEKINSTIGDEQIQIRDTCFEILLAYCDEQINLDRIFRNENFTNDPFDTWFNWILMTIVTSLPSFAHRFNKEIFKKISLNFIAKLESLGLWEWAIVVAKHNQQLNQMFTGNLLKLHCTPLRGDRITNEKEKLITSVFVTDSLINESKALAARQIDRFDLQFIFLLKAQNWKKAHNILFWEIALKQIVYESYKTNKLEQKLLNLKQYNDQIPKWDQYGGLLLDYLSFRNQTKNDKILINLNEMQLMSLDQIGKSICSRTQILSPRKDNLIDHVCFVLIIENCSNLIMKIKNLLSKFVSQNVILSQSLDFLNSIQPSSINHRERPGDIHKMTSNFLDQLQI